MSRFCRHMEPDDVTHAGNGDVVGRFWLIEVLAVVQMCRSRTDATAALAGLLSHPAVLSPLILLRTGRAGRVGKALHNCLI